MDSIYPVTFAVDYPDRELRRLSTAFRIVTAIPIAIVLAVVSGADRHYLVTGGGILVGGPLLMILFRQKYPRWWFEWNLQLLRFSARVGVYLTLMDDRYPSTDEPQAVTLELPYPDAKTDLHRWLPLVKWFLAIPHYVVLGFLILGAIFVVIGAWFAILVTGRYPRALFDYLVGVGRWTTRVNAYAFVLVTDRYPPFRLAP